MGGLGEPERAPERPDDLDLGPDLVRQLLDRELLALGQHEAVEGEELVGAGGLGLFDLVVGHPEVLEDIADLVTTSAAVLRHAPIVRCRRRSCAPSDPRAGAVT